MAKIQITNNATKPSAASGEKKGLNAFMGSYLGNALLAVAAFLVLALLVIRVGPGQMDFLIATNLALSVSIFLAALYVGSTALFTSFPAILLISTLFRLALNIATTKLILLEANAGNIIFTFGEFVVGGNFIVGAVVFILITVVQFLVVAKGAERVAQVAARFTLDAMPQKMMAIDNEMARMENPDPEEFRLRRSAVDRESKVYSAMEGAVVFVKGDAIAGIIISLVNIIGGLLIGVLQQGMDLGQAAQTYTILTIGDGLVSQIPALMCSFSAGLVVTRVGSSDSSKGSAVPGLAADIGRQLFGNPLSIFVSAGLLVALASIGASRSSFDATPFWVLGAILTIVGVWRYRSTKPKEAKAETKTETIASAGTPPERILTEPKKLESAQPPELSQIRLEFNRNIYESVFGPNRELEAYRVVIRDGINRRLYVNLPHFDIFPSDQIPPFSWSLFIHNALVFNQTIGPIFLDEARPRLDELGIRYMRVVDISNQTHLMISPADLKKAEESGLLAQDLAWSIVAYGVFQKLLHNAHRLWGITQTQEYLKTLDPKHTELRKAVVGPKALTLATVADVMKNLLREQVSIQDLRGICEALARRDEPQTTDHRKLTEMVRIELAPAICTRLALNSSLLEYYTIDNTIGEFVQLFADGQIGPFHADVKDVIQSIKEDVEKPNIRRQPAAVILVYNEEIRRPLREMIENDLPGVFVISNREFNPHTMRERRLGEIQFRKREVATGSTASGGER
ncbi:MAG: FHIPEP family type III secretion protein [Planctomycetes bacterium]|nr:FHIPEP family type III secretion protein [Planctomycetota bacterium]